MKTPIWITMQEHVEQTSRGALELPAGSFVKPIRKDYWPAHIRKAYPSWAYDEDLYCMCYTSQGMMMLPWKILREVGE